jgi:hypothetical protein
MFMRIISEGPNVEMVKNIYIYEKTTYFVLSIKQDTIFSLLFIFNDLQVQGNDPFFKGFVSLLLNLQIAIYGLTLGGF